MLSELMDREPLAENHHLDSVRPPLRGWIKRLAAALLLVFLITGFYWKLVLTDQYTWLQSPDLAYQVLPWYQFQAGEWNKGRFPTWDPYHWGGQPVVGQMITGAAFPLNWVLFSRPLRNGWIKQFYLHWYFVAMHLIAAWAMYRLARDLGCRRPSAMLAACVFTLGGWMATIDWPVMLNGAMWAPLVLLYVLRALRGERPLASGVYGGFFFGLAWLSGHHQIPIYLALASLGLWIYTLILRRRSKRVWAGCLLFWILTGATGALQILPAYEYGKHAVRWVGLDEPLSWDQKVPYDVHRKFQFRPAAIVGIVFPGMWEHVDPYLGWCALLLALLAVALAWDRADVRALVFVALGGLGFALAGYSVFHGVLYALVPMVEKARNPSFAFFLFHAAAAALAGVGLQRWLDARDAMWTQRWERACLALAAFVVLIRAGVALVRGFDANFDDRPMLTALVALLMAGIFLWRRRGDLRPAPAASLLLLLCLFEAGMNNGYLWPSTLEKNRNTYLAQHAANGDIAEFLRRREPQARVSVDDESIQYNWGDWHGLQQINGYLASLTVNLRRHEAHEKPFNDLMGVAYAIRRTPHPTWPEDVFTGASGLKVWRNPSAFPRAFAVHKTARIPSREHIPFWMKDPARDHHQEAFLLDEPPPLASCAGPDEVRIVDYQPGHVRLRARLACRGMVILSDTNYPGWRARVDGTAARIFEPYGLVRGVVAEAGTHEILFEYRPVSVFLGAALSALAAAAVLLFRLTGH